MKSFSNSNPPSANSKTDAINNTNALNENDDGRTLAELKAVLENAVDAIITIDPQGIMQTVNPATEKMFGYSAVEMLGKNVSMLMPPQYSDNHDQYLDNYTRTSKRKIIGIGREVMAQRRDGTTFPIDLAVSESNANEKRFFTGVIRDLTDRKAIEAKLRVSARALAAAGQGVCVLNAATESSPIESCNPALPDITGYQESELIGRPLSAIRTIPAQTPPNPQTDRPEHDHASKETQWAADQPGTDDLDPRSWCGSDASANAKQVIACTKANGTHYWAQIDISPVRDDDGQTTHYVAVIADVTDQIESERWLQHEVQQRTRALEDAQAKLVQQEKLAVLGRISGSIAHEIRNPLNAIKTSAYFLINAKAPKPEKVHEHLRRIDRQVTLINHVITVLSDAAKMPPPVQDPVSIASLIDEAVMSVDVPATVEIVRELADDLLPVWIDANQIAIVLRNLLRNARDAMAGGGKITITASNSPDETSAIVSIADTGTGIPPDVLPRIREPLFTTKATGMGLGLSISYNIVESNRGEIRVESQVGEGATFELRLPTDSASQVANSTNRPTHTAKQDDVPSQSPKVDREGTS